VVVLLAFGLVGVVARSQIGETPTATREAQLAQLAQSDPDLAEAVEAANLPLPLPDDPEIVEGIRRNHQLIRSLSPPVPAGVVSAYGVVPQPVRPLPPEGHLGTCVRLSQPGDAQQVAAEKLLKQQPVPAERTALFAGLLKTKGMRLEGWQVDVKEVNAVDGVTTIRVRAYPIITQYGGIGTTCGVLEETYEVADGRLTLVKTRPLGYPESWMSH
jgi:hypothetical protein